MLLSTAIKGFEIFLKAEGYAAATVVLYTGYCLPNLKRFTGDIEIEDLTKDQLRLFFISLQERELSPSTRENFWKAIKTFSRWLNTELHIPRVDDNLPRPKYKSAEIVPFTEYEIRKLLSACARTRLSDTYKRRRFTMPRPTANRDQAIMLLLLDTGLRVSEAARLSIEDVNMETGEVFVQPFGTGQKTKSRVVYMGTSALKALWKYLSSRKKAKPSEPIFLSIRGNPMNRDSIRQVLVNIGKRAGVKNVHPHKFRHTFAIQYLRNSGDIFTLQRLLGHSTLTMVQHYLAIADSDAENAHKRASPADNWRL
jgi:integrase/recombinase XerD